MRIEVTPSSVDILATKEGAINFGVSAASFLLMLAIVGFVVSMLITVVAVALVLPVAWWQHRTPERTRPESRPTASTTVGLTS